MAESDSIQNLIQQAKEAANKKYRKIAIELNLKIIEIDPNNIGALIYLFYHSKIDDKTVYANSIQRIIHSPDFDKGQLRNFAEVDRVTKRFRVNESEFEVKAASQEDEIAQIRMKMSQGKVSADEAKEILESLKDDNSIRATILKAEIYVRVYGNPDQALRLIEQRKRKADSKSKAVLGKAEDVIRGFKNRGTSLDSLVQIDSDSTESER